MSRNTYPKKAILVPANPSLNYYSGATVGSIFAHTAHIEKTGKAIWRLIPQRNSNTFYHSCQRGYFYNVPEKKVTHVFNIERIFSPSEKLPKKYQKYLIPARKDHDAEGTIQLVMTGIYRLAKKHELSDFKKCSDDSHVRRVQNYSIVYDPQLNHRGKQETMEEIISDYLYDFLQGEKISEKDIEELFLYYLSEKKQLIDRQGSVKKSGRFDLLFKDIKGKYVVYELKKGIAPPSTLKQIKRYMKACMKEHKIPKSKIRGIILCKDVPSELYTEIKNEKEFSIKVCKYQFKIEMK